MDVFTTDPSADKTGGYSSQQVEKDVMKRIAISSCKGIMIGVGISIVLMIIFLMIGLIVTELKNKKDKEKRRNSIIGAYFFICNLIISICMVYCMFPMFQGIKSVIFALIFMIVTIVNTIITYNYLISYIPSKFLNLNTLERSPPRQIIDVEANGDTKEFEVVEYKIDAITATKINLIVLGIQVGISIISGIVYNIFGIYTTMFIFLGTFLCYYLVSFFSKDKNPAINNQ